MAAESRSAAAEEGVEERVREALRAMGQDRGAWHMEIKSEVRGEGRWPMEIKNEGHQERGERRGETANGDQA